MIRHETQAYRLSEDRFGNFMLRRNADGAEAYFQGDDATLMDHNMSLLEGINPWTAGNTFDDAFDHICGGYDEVLACA